MNDAMQTLLAAAVCAPSGDNTQPWRFVVDAASNQITFYVDPTRDPSPMNAGQHMAHIAIGAALENVLRTCQKNGWNIQLEEISPPALARIRLDDSQQGVGDIEEVIRARVTNRRFYEGGDITPETLAQLERETPVLDCVTTHWIVNKDRLAALAALIADADAFMLSEASMRRAFLANIRFNAPADAQVEQGLSLASIELSASEHIGLQLMPWIPNWLVKFSAHRLFAKRARQLVESASGLCLLLAPDYATQTDLSVGRAMQRAWLALSARRLAVQPMMSLVVLENIFENGSTQLVNSLGRQELQALRGALRRAAPEIGPNRPAFLMRFGYAPAASGRTGRLPWEASLREA